MNHKRPRKLGFYDSFYPIYFGAGNLKDILPYSSFWQHSANLEIFYEDYHQREREREREGRDRNYRHCFSTVLEMVIKCLIVYFLFYKRNIFSLQIFFKSAVSSKIDLFRFCRKVLYACGNPNPHRPHYARHKYHASKWETQSRAERLKYSCFQMWAWWLCGPGRMSQWFPTATTTAPTTSSSSSNNNSSPRQILTTAVGSQMAVTPLNLFCLCGNTKDQQVRKGLKSIS